MAGTAGDGGRLTPATEVEYTKKIKKYFFDGEIYRKRVYHGAGDAHPEAELKYGPNIADWPEMIPLGQNVLIKAVSVITDPVTTTDELIPSGETSSYRSNPMKLAEFALSRKDPGYVGRAKAVKADEDARRATGELPESVLREVEPRHIRREGTIYGSCVVAVKPGDGSAREQAASCQRVLGGIANVAEEYATKRYRSNLINWGMLPFTAKKLHISLGDYIYVEDIDKYIAEGAESVPAKLLSGKSVKDVTLGLGSLTPDERSIILKGCLINFNAVK